jgi:hypothetical protein
MNNRSHKQKLGVVKYILTLTLKITVLVTSVSLVYPAVSTADGFLRPAGTAETAVAVWLPTDSVQVPVTVTADFIAERDLPRGISYPPGSVGQALTFGIWQGDGTTLDQFTPSIVINMAYKDGDIPPSVRSEEKTLHLYMYNSATKSWIKLCGSVDVHENVVSAALSLPTPFERNGSSLLAIAIDETPTLEQELDDQGITTVSIKRSDLRLEVESFVIDVGSHFVITLLSRISESGRVKLLSRPVDIKVCRVDHTGPDQNNRQITNFFKPLKVGFDIDSDTASRAGGKANLTIVNLQSDQWIDTEEVGSRVIRGDSVVTVDTRNLGTFGLGAR